MPGATFFSRAERFFHVFSNLGQRRYTGAGIRGDLKVALGGLENGRGETETDTKGCVFHSFTDISTIFGYFYVTDIRKLKEKLNILKGGWTDVLL